MRPAPAILLAALTTATLVPFGEQPAAASCAAPYLTDAPDLVLHRGAAIEIDGAAFANGCQDTGSCSAVPGCGGCDYGPDPTPMRDITLSLRQRGRTWLLDTADARATRGDFGTVTWIIDVPTQVKRGRATLVPEHGQPTKVRVR